MSLTMSRTTPASGTMCPYAWMCPHVRLCREAAGHPSPLDRDSAMRVVSQYTDEEVGHILEHMLRGDPLRAVPLSDVVQPGIPRLLPQHLTGTAKVDYSGHFLRGGHHVHDDLVIDAGGQITLRNSRGVFFKNIPRGTRRKYSPSPIMTLMVLYS